MSTTGSSAESSAEPTAAPAQPEKDRSLRGTRADIALLRAHGDVRARCIAALLVPFIAYFVVLLVLGATGRQYLLFIFIPVVIAGVLVGTFLDLGHRRYPRT